MPIENIREYCYYYLNVFQYKWVLGYLFPPGQSHGLIVKIIGTDGSTDRCGAISSYFVDQSTPHSGK